METFCIHQQYSGDTWLNIFVKNLLNYTSTGVNIIVCKLKLNKPDLMKELPSIKIFKKRKLWDTKW